MKKSLEQFFQTASQDQQLQEKLKAAPNREAYISSVVGLGKEKGYSFTIDEVATALEVAAKKAGENGEETSVLSEEQLNAVAGGSIGGFEDIFGGGPTTTTGNIMGLEPL